MGSPYVRLLILKSSLLDSVLIHLLNINITSLLLAEQHQCDTTYTGIVPPESAERSANSSDTTLHNAITPLSPSPTDSLDGTSELGGQVAKNFLQPSPQMASNWPESLPEKPKFCSGMIAP